MGGFMSCKRSKKNESFSEHNPQSFPQSTKPKAIILGKNRKIIQKDKELYQVVFEADGFSVHDLALLGQKNSPESIIRRKVIPRRVGRVELIDDITELISKKTSQTIEKSTKSSSNRNQEMQSPGDFEIVEIRDYVDDLYLQLLEPPGDGDEPKDSTSTTETNKSNN